MKKGIVFALFLLIVFSGVCVAEQVDDEVLQGRIKEVSKTLRCAVCQSESVWESNATLAIQMRKIVRERLIAGESPEEIRAYFVSRYGDFILLKPRVRGLNRLLWFGPFILLAFGGFFLYRTLRRWTARPVPTEPDAGVPIDDAHRRRIEEELRSFNK
ncbi:MAG: cytochrome c-type biogenesis protein [Nitrospira sp.]|nr:cytochrome c-type biogenesis protein CcmH [Candidatus Manganitrophaceae bacterium]HIL34376.1 cytochrome c-type biogenesis protein CcmH [Candidatus Manganitrophaceae bacterium]